MTNIMLVLIKRGLCVRGYVATDQLTCPCWHGSIAKSACNGHVSIRAGQRWLGPMNHVFLYNLWMAKCVCVVFLEKRPGCIMGRRWACTGSVMLWAMYCWEILRNNHCYWLKPRRDWNGVPCVVSDLFQQDNAGAAQDKWFKNGSRNTITS